MVSHPDAHHAQALLKQLGVGVTRDWAQGALQSIGAVWTSWDVGRRQEALMALFLESDLNMMGSGVLPEGIEVRMSANTHIPSGLTFEDAPLGPCLHQIA
eukprot:scaffold197239_cov34-Prasinocladus_malaysianus.AAC.2